jgi:uncharacterized protein YyaL (SSP411 family)
MAVLALIKLYKLTGDERYHCMAETTMQTCAELMQRFPSGTAQMLLAVDLFLGPMYEFVFVGDEQAESKAAIADLHRRFLPHKVLAYTNNAGATQLDDLLAGKSEIGGEPTLYICEGFTCREPVHGKDNIARALDALA